MYNLFKVPVIKTFIILFSLIVLGCNEDTNDKTITFTPSSIEVGTKNKNIKIKAISKSFKEGKFSVISHIKGVNVESFTVIDSENAEFVVSVVDSAKPGWYEDGFEIQIDKDKLYIDFKIDESQFVPLKGGGYIIGNATFELGEKRNITITGYDLRVNDLVLVIDGSPHIDTTVTSYIHLPPQFPFVERFTLRADVTIHDDVTPGDYTVYVATSDGTKTVTFTVIDDPTPPDIIFTPSFINKDSENVDISVQGNNTQFENGTTYLTYDCTGVTLSINSITSTSGLTLDATVSEETTIDECEVTFNTYGEHVSGTINIPGITMLDIQSGQKGKNVRVNIYGSKTNFDQNSSYITGLSYENLLVYMPNRIRTDFVIPEDATTGIYEFSIITGDEVVSATFMVTDGDAFIEMPNNSVLQGSSDNEIGVIGHFLDFTQGTTISSTECNLSFSDITSIDSSNLTFNVDAPLDVPDGLCLIKLSVDGSDFYNYIQVIQTLFSIETANGTDDFVSYSNTKYLNADIPIFYKFNLDAGKVVKIRAIRDIFIFVDPVLELSEDINFENILAFNDDENNATRNSLMVFQSSADGTYYLKIHDRLGINSGDVTIEIDEYNTGLMDESEPNDNFTQSTSLTTKTVKGYMGSTSDEDYYEINQTFSSTRIAVQVIALDVSPYETSGADVKLTVYDDSENLEATSLIGTYFMDPVIYMDLADTAFVKITNEGTSNTVYWLNIRPSVIINEVFYNGNGSNTAEFIELYGEPNRSLDNCKLLVNANDGTSDSTITDIALDGFSLNVAGYFVLAHDQLVVGTGDDYIDDNLQISSEFDFESISVNLVCNSDYIDTVCFLGSQLSECATPIIPDYETSYGRGFFIDTDNSLNDFMVQIEESPWHNNLTNVTPEYNGCFGDKPYNNNQNGVCSGSKKVCIDKTWEESSYSLISEYETTESVCDGIDSNCDGSVDEGLLITYYADSDSDGYGDLNSTIHVCDTSAPTGYIDNNTDCNDNDGSCVPSGCNTYYADTDSDGYGDPNDSTSLCSAPTGYVDNSNDCASNNPGYPIVLYVDSDHDGYGSTTEYYSCEATPLSGYEENNTDCNDSSDLINPDALEVCDSTDNDCDSITDAGTCQSNASCYDNSGVDEAECACDQGYTEDPDATNICRASGYTEWAIQNPGSSDFYNYKVDYLPDGSIVTIGNFKGTITIDGNNYTATASWDSFLIKHDSSGNIDWVRVFNSTGNAIGMGVGATDSGDIIVTVLMSGTLTYNDGLTTQNVTSAGYNDIFLIKYDTYGFSDWAFTDGGTNWDTVKDLYVKGDYFYITGGFSGTAYFGTIPITCTGYIDVFLAKYNVSNGNPVWANVAGGTSEDWGNAIAADHNGNVAITGTYRYTSTFDTKSVTSNGGVDAFLANYDSSGNIRWVRGYGGSSTSTSYPDIGKDIDFTNDGAVLTCGSYFSSMTFGSCTSNQKTLSGNSTNANVYLLKFSPEGGFLWGTEGGGSGDESAYVVKSNENGDAFITGFSSSATITFGEGSYQEAVSGGGSYDGYVAKYNPVGDLMWLKTGSGSGDDKFYGLGLNENEVAVTGFFKSSSIDLDDGTVLTRTGSVSDSLLIEYLQGDNDYSETYLPSGQLDWIYTATPSSNYDIAFTIDYFSNGDKLLTGIHQNGSITFDSSTLSSSSGYNSYILRKTKDGTNLWLTGVYNSNDVQIRRALVLSDDSFLVGGYFDNSVTLGDGKYAQTVDGVGRSQSVFLAKYNSAGELLWVTAGGSLGEDTLRIIDVDSNGNIFITGQFDRSITFGSTTAETKDDDMYIAKFNSSTGACISINTIGGTGNEDGEIKILSNNDYIAVGQFSGTVNFGGTSLTSTNGSIDFFIAKYNSSNTLQWVRQGTSTSTVSGYNVDIDSSGNIYAIGYFLGTATFNGSSVTSKGNIDNFVAKYNSSGTIQWVKRFGGTSNDYGGYVIKVNSDDDIYFGGHYYSNPFYVGTGSTEISYSNAGNYDGYVIKLNSCGEVVWLKRHAGTSFDGIYDLGFNDGKLGIAGTYSYTVTFGEGDNAVTKSGSYLDSVFFELNQ
jgi:Putative metal-binding motif